MLEQLRLVTLYSNAFQLRFVEWIMYTSTYGRYLRECHMRKRSSRTNKKQQPKDAKWRTTTVQTGYQHGGISMAAPPSAHQYCRKTARPTVEVRRK